MFTVPFYRSDIHLKILRVQSEFEFKSALNTVLRLQNKPKPKKGVLSKVAVGFSVSLSSNKIFEISHLGLEKMRVVTDTIGTSREGSDKCATESPLLTPYLMKMDRW